ncbi:MAG: hypothetical protein LBT26_09690 [Clostridiales Family XIII bacterium]|jgi:hypothetical protein|nr:hypothetical protein [Clostridiales Family XIII bacterium]
MPKTFRRFAFILALACAAAGLAACDRSKTEYDADGNAVMPPAVEKIQEAALRYAKEGAVNFNGTWANGYKEMIAAGKEADPAQYKKRQAMLDIMRQQTRARSIYILSPDDRNEGEFLVTLFSTKNEDGTLADSHEAAALLDAWEGKAAAELSAWDYEPRDPCWSAYAPIYDGEGVIVAVFGIDLPAPSILSYPEWNRDHRRWNGASR